MENEIGNFKCKMKIKNEIGKWKMEIVEKFWNKNEIGKSWEEKKEREREKKKNFLKVEKRKKFFLEKFKSRKIEN